MISELQFERYRLGEMSSEEKHAIEAECDAAVLEKKLAALDESDKELSHYFETLPPRLAAPRLSESAPRRRFVSRGIKLRVAIAAAALLLWAVLPGRLILNRVIGGEEADGSSVAAAVPGTAEADRAKGVAGSGGAGGTPELSVYVKTDGENAAPIKPGTALRAGNTVQLAYETPAGGKRYGVIFSVDGRAAVTLHYPYGQSGDTLLVSGKRTPLAEAYTLDDAPDYETFFMAVSAEALDARRILATARRLAGNKPEEIEAALRSELNNCTVVSVRINKQERGK